MTPYSTVFIFTSNYSLKAINAKGDAYSKYNLLCGAFPSLLATEGSLAIQTRHQIRHSDSFKYTITTHPDQRSGLGANHVLGLDQCNGGAVSMQPLGAGDTSLPITDGTSDGCHA